MKVQIGLVFFSSFLESIKKSDRYSPSSTALGVIFRVGASPKEIKQMLYRWVLLTVPEKWKGLLRLRRALQSSVLKLKISGGMQN